MRESCMYGSVRGARGVPTATGASSSRCSAARRYARVLLPLKRHLKCSARSTQPIRHRRTAPQAPRNRIRANADNRKTSSPSLCERLWQPPCWSTYRTPVSGVFRRNAFWFRGLWRKPGQHFAVRGKNPAGQFLQEEHDEVQRTCASSAYGVSSSRGHMADG